MCVFWHGTPGKTARGIDRRADRRVRQTGQARPRATTATEDRTPDPLTKGPAKDRDGDARRRPHSSQPVTPMTRSKALAPVEDISRAILILRGQRVILDADLAALYGVTTKRLNEQVKRNAARFPDRSRPHPPTPRRRARPSWPTRASGRSSKRGSTSAPASPKNGSHATGLTLLTSRRDLSSLQSNDSAHAKPPERRSHDFVSSP